eukprot:13540074-Ditylum_brightwellii.AAC.1
MGQARKQLDGTKFKQQDDMLYIIGQFLNLDNNFPKEAEDLCDIVTAMCSNGYTALYKLLH